MHLQRHAVSFFIYALLTIFCAASFVSAQPNINSLKMSSVQNTARVLATPEISYIVSMSQPYTHLLEVEMRVRGANDSNLSPQIDLVLPVWTPGSYLIREYARHVQDFSAMAFNPNTAAANEKLGWQKINKDTWRVSTSGAPGISVKYRVYANELTVRTNELNDRHAAWNNAALLMYIDGFLNAPATLKVMPFGNWQVATGLPAVENQANTFRAENFDALYDSPFEVGNFKTLNFNVQGIPHRIVIDGEGNYDANTLTRDVQKIVETAGALMGEVPYRDYTFILHLRQTGSGGLEHLNSTALIFRRFGFRPAESYKSFLSLVAHEYFHLWNVKRIRPDALGPFDYTKENYTRLLWVAEGLTEYYQGVLVRRANLISDREYLRDMARAFEALQNTPGRRVMSVEEASFDAWIKFYRPDENTPNSQISYYDKGAILSLLLDLEIRRASENKKSLDDVMRYLYNEFYKRKRNYTPQDFQRASELMAGTSLDKFFAAYVRGREEFDYNAALSVAGLRLETTTGNAPEKAFLGANLVQDGDKLTVRNVLAGTPAYEQGLNAGDQIVAVDGVRASRDFLTARIEEKKPGDEIVLTVFRNDDLREFRLKLGRSIEEKYRIVPLADANEQQRAVYESWLGTSFPKTASDEE
ncbi:MAG: PDZ domain-containing protein [Pyrinomonadaceae bacterium]